VLRSMCRNILSSQRHCWDYVTAPIALAYFYPGSWPTFSPAFTAASLEGATMPDGRRFRGWDSESHEGKETRRLREAGKLQRWGEPLPGFIVERTEVFPGWDEPITERR
jgi:hypothetical protein